MGGVDGLIRTPRRVAELPDDLREAVVASVAESVVGVIWWGVPIMVTILILATLVRETPLRTTSAIGGDSKSNPDAGSGSDAAGRHQPDA